MTGPSSQEGIDVVGVRVRDANMDEVVTEILDWTERPGPVRVAVGVNAHVCNQATRDVGFRKLIRDAELAYADGQSIVWAARLLGRRLPERVATTDLVFPLTRAAAVAGKRVFLYGSAPGVAERAAARLVELQPGLQIETSDGYVPADQMDALVHRINTFETDILFVGLGDPRQQEWVSQHRDALQVPAVLTCGGLFDWTSGANRRPPQWMVRGGLEWFWRVLIEPRRLAARYLLGNPAFVMRVLRQYFADRRSR